MELLQIIFIAIAVYLVVDIYRRFLNQERRFGTVLFLLKATQKALDQKGVVTREDIYNAQKKVLYSMPEGELHKTKKDLQKEGIDIQP